MKTETNPVPNNTFSTVLSNLREGELLNELSAGLQTLTMAVKEHTKQGKIILDLNISPANGDASALLIVGTVTVKAPKGKRPSSIFYSTDEGILMRNDPNQREMELRELPKVEPAPIATLPQPKSALA